MSNSTTTFNIYQWKSLSPPNINSNLTHMIYILTWVILDYQTFKCAYFWFYTKIKSFGLGVMDGKSD